MKRLLTLSTQRTEEPCGLAIDGVEYAIAQIADRGLSEFLYFTALWTTMQKAMQGAQERGVVDPAEVARIDAYRDTLLDALLPTMPGEVRDRLRVSEQLQILTAAMGAQTEEAPGPFAPSPTSSPDSNGSTAAPPGPGSPAPGG
jgi:hypothetical protein